MLPFQAIVFAVKAQFILALTAFNKLKKLEAFNWRGSESELLHVRQVRDVETLTNNSHCKMYDDKFQVGAEPAFVSTF